MNTRVGFLIESNFYEFFEKMCGSDAYNMPEWDENFAFPIILDDNNFALRPDEQYFYEEVFFACALCYCPVISERYAIYDENVGLICPVNHIRGFGTVENFNDISIPHWEHLVECEHCMSPLSFVYNIPDRVLNFQSNTCVAILDLRNMVSGVTYTMYAERRSPFHVLMDRQILISTNTVHNSGMVYEISSDDESSDDEILMLVNTVYEVSSDSDGE